MRRHAKRRRPGARTPRPGAGRNPHRGRLRLGSAPEGRRSAAPVVKDRYPQRVVAGAWMLVAARSGTPPEDSRLIEVGTAKLWGSMRSPFVVEESRSAGGRLAGVMVWTDPVTISTGEWLRRAVRSSSATSGGHRRSAARARGASTQHLTCRRAAGPSPRQTLSGSACCTTARTPM